MKQLYIKRPNCAIKLRNGTTCAGYMRGVYIWHTLTSGDPMIEIDQNAMNREMRKSFDLVEWAIRRFEEQYDITITSIDVHKDHIDINAKRTEQ